MATTTITYPNTLTNGTTADADEVMANLNAVKTAIETTKMGTGNLQAPNAIFPITFAVDALTASQSIELRTVVPVGVTFVSAVLNVDGLTNSGVANMQIYQNSLATQILTVACSASAVDTPSVKSAFDVASVSASDELIFVISETAGGSATLSDVSATLWCTAVHQA